MESKYFWIDLIGGGSAGRSSAFMAEYWSTLSKTSVMGDPTKATAEKGRRILEAAVQELMEIAKELKVRVIRERIDHH